MALQKVDEKSQKAQHAIECIRNDSKLKLEIVLNCLEFTWNCPVVQQPDYGTIEIVYTPDRRIAETKSLKFYLQTYRYRNAFNEELCQRIALDFIYYVQPVDLTVTLKQNQRGGIQNISSIEYIAERDSSLVKNYTPKKDFRGGWPMLTKEFLKSL